jgi:hypothetical protein
MPFSSASFRAKGDAKTRSLAVVVAFCSSFFPLDVVCCSVLLVESSFFVGSFSFFSVFSDEGVCSSDDFFFVDDSLPSSL